MRYLTEIPINTQIDEIFSFINELGSTFSSCQNMTIAEKESLLMRFDDVVTSFLYEKRNMRCYEE